MDMHSKHSFVVRDGLMFFSDEYEEFVRINGADAISHQACDTFCRSLDLAEKKYGDDFTPLQLFKIMHVHAVDFYGLFAGSILQLIGLGTTQDFLVAYSQMHNFGMLTRKEPEELCPILEMQNPCSSLSSERLSFEQIKLNCHFMMK